MSMGSGSTMYLLRKKRVNGRISTKSEIVGLENALTQCLWSRYFIEGHGYAEEELELHQDNMSDILMENNGKHSITKRTKNIQMRYFFIKDHIENGDLSLKYCLTGKLYTDFFTKAL